MTSFARGFGYFASGILVTHFVSDNFEYATLANLKVPAGKISFTFSIKYPYTWKKELEVPSDPPLINQSFEIIEEYDDKKKQQIEKK